MSTPSSFVVERSVVIRARRSTVFRYFTDAARFATWWGAGSSIEGWPGGQVQIRYPEGTTAGGEVVEIVADERIVFTYGYDDPSQPIARGGSRVTITLADHAEGTLLRLVHEVADEATRNDHVPGWRFQLSLFANVAAQEQQGEVAAVVDRFFAVWSEPDPVVRGRTLADIVTDGVVFRDAFAAIAGRGDLADHVTASRIHMPGVTLRRDGAVLHCQGTALVDWIVEGADGAPRGRGNNVVELDLDGRIARVVGFWRR